MEFRRVLFRSNSIRLVAPDAQLAWDPATEAQLRAILTDLVKPGAPPKITGIANGFHVAGTLPGEGETQLFLDTATGDPGSLAITTRSEERRVGEECGCTWKTWMAPYK